jgi:polyhydroxyalkanoate synthase
VAAARRRSRKEGVLSGRELARVFAWLRPNDLVWNYWVNNYLMGKNPPAFDVLAWNADAVDLPASLHGDFMDMAQSNSLTHPGELRVLGTGVDLGKVTVDSYVVGAVTDHICPWRACYPVVDLMGGSVEFVLSSQGHIQALINPSGNPKGSYRTTDGDDPARGADDSAGKPTADEWLERATEHPGSWWDHWVEWLEPRSGEERNARRKLGSKAHPPIEDAPGSYVRATV